MTAAILMLFLMPVSLYCSEACTCRTGLLYHSILFLKVLELTKQKGWLHRQICHVKRMSTILMRLSVSFWSLA